MKIEDFSQIIIYRHINPDFDAYGSQLGVYHILKELYPDKRICLAGNMTESIIGCYREFDVLEPVNTDTLGIVLDTSNSERIDGDITLCNKVIKIDHHPVVEQYGDINIEYPTASSACEIVTLLAKEQHIRINKSAAEALYLGIIGDSERFLYDSTTVKTFEAASYLLESGIEITKLYQSIYLKDQKTLENEKYIYSKCTNEGPIGYFVLLDEDIKKMGVTRNEASSNVKLLANIKEYPIWLCVTENTENNNFRVSIRSREITINEVARKYNGGGHRLASGCSLDSLDDLPHLLKDLKELV